MQYVFKPKWPFPKLTYKSSRLILVLFANVLLLFSESSRFFSLCFLIIILAFIVIINMKYFFDFYTNYNSILNIKNGIVAYTKRNKTVQFTREDVVNFDIVKYEKYELGIVELRNRKVIRLTSFIINPYLLAKQLGIKKYLKK